MQAAPDRDQDVFHGLTVFVEGTDIEIGEVIGEGGQGYVQKATLIPNREVVAVKQYQFSEHYLDRITSEISHLKTAAGHVGIVKLIGIYKRSQNSRSQQGLVLEYCEGGSLDQVITRDPNPLKEQMKWIEQIMEAMRYLHNLGIIHRDLKPANILFTSKDLKHIKLCDFSDCTTLPKDSAVIEHTSQRGTPGFRDSEIELGRPYGDKADVFSLGRTILCILFRVNPGQVGQVGLPYFDYWSYLTDSGCLDRDMFDIVIPPNKGHSLWHEISIIILKLLRLSGQMFSTDVAKRPTMTAACDSLSKILVDESRMIYDLDSRQPYLLQRVLDFSEKLLEGGKRMKEMEKEKMTLTGTESRFLDVHLRALVIISMILPYCKEQRSVREREGLRRPDLTVDRMFELTEQAWKIFNKSDNEDLYCLFDLIESISNIEL